MNYRYSAYENHCFPKDLCAERNYLCGTRNLENSCQRSAGDYSCKCSAGYFNFNSKSCLSNRFRNGRILLIRFSFGNLVYHGLDEAENVVYRNISLGNNFITNFQYDYATRNIYWASNNNNQGVIYKGGLYLRGEQRLEKIYEDKCSIEIVALDWIHKNLYFSCSRTMSIEVISLMNPVKQIQIARVDDLKIVRLDPSERYLFVATSNALERMELDGSNRRMIFKTTSYDIIITRFSLDLEEKRVYLMISNENSIISFDYNANHLGRFAIFKFDKGWNDFFYVLGNYVYLPFKNEVRRIDKMGTRFVTRQAGKVSIKAAKMEHPALQPYDFNPCFYNCTGSCLVNRLKLKCFRNF